MLAIDHSTYSSNEVLPSLDWNIGGAKASTTGWIVAMTYGVIGGADNVGWT